MKDMSPRRPLILALTLSNLVLAVPAAAQTQPYTVEVTLEHLARAPKVITVSPTYQVVLRFPVPLSGLSVQIDKQKNYKITPMQNRQVYFIDARAKSGEADMYAVLPDTSILPFRLVIKNQPSGTRVYRVLGEGEVAQGAATPPPVASTTRTRPVAPSTPTVSTASTAAVQARPSATSATPARAASRVTSQPQVPTLPAGTGTAGRTAAPAAAPRPTAPAPAASTARPSQLGAQVSGLPPAADDTPLDDRLTARREGGTLVIDYTLKSKATRALIVRYQDLRIMNTAGGRLNVTHLKTPQFGALLPGRTIQGTVRVEAPVNSVVLEWPISNLATREHYSFNRVVAVKR